MTNSPTAVVKADASTDDDQRADQASDAFMIGVDTNGREHYCSRIRDCVTVIDDDGAEQTQALNDRPLKNWMAFVEQELGGWDETNVYSGSTFTHLVRQLGNAVTVGEA
ncbi:hypothetical protein [Halocatena marina]|uniref:hypothetical protein n=1 Tax=Halocatena marina TaxID=2934937 RepID=UPI00200C2BA8|nr:hypothetical protein [Halocatena marina]